MIEPTSFPSVSNMKSIAGNSEIPPVCLTHWPTFVSRKFPQVQLLVGEFVDPIFRRVARAHRRANGALKPAPRWFLISQNHPRTVRLETPASAVDQIVSLIAVLSENPKYLRNIPKYCKQFKIFNGSKVSVTNAAVAEHLQSVLTSYGRG